MKWFFNRSSQEQSTDLEVSKENLPSHVAIIMDGNGRWARRRGLPRVAGHHTGMTVVRDIIRASDDIGLKYLTLYAFSTENWKRPRAEVEYLMRLPEEFFRSEIDELVERGVRVRFIGDTTKLPRYTQETVHRTLERTEQNTGMTVCFALNYGGRADIIGAIKALVEDFERKGMSLDALSEEVFREYLSTYGIPDPDLIIRTSGEQRLSNFLIWQAAYAEFWVTDSFWPDFTRDHLRRAIIDYQKRRRRFGGLK
jgi:undecaprenyl diphosphate synthase